MSRDRKAFWRGVDDFVLRSKGSVNSSTSLCHEKANDFNKHLKPTLGWGNQRCQRWVQNPSDDDEISSPRPRLNIPCSLNADHQEGAVEGSY